MGARQGRTQVRETGTRPGAGIARQALTGQQGIVEEARHQTDADVQQTRTAAGAGVEKPEATVPVLKKPGPAGMSRMVISIGPVLPVTWASTVVGPTVTVNGPSGICWLISIGRSHR